MIRSCDGDSLLSEALQVLTTNRGESFTGSLVSLDAASLVMTTDRSGVNRVVSRSAIQRVELGHHRSRGKTVLYGALAGLIVGITTGHLSGDDAPGLLSFTAGDKAILGSVLLVPVGALTGVLIGPSTERWTPAELGQATSASAPHLTVIATPARVGIAGSIKW